MQKSGEDYLEALLMLVEETGSENVHTTDVARHLGVSKPSVSRAMGILRDEGYVNQETYGVITLSEKGRAKASQVLSRHQILLRFFHEVLGVEQKIAEHDACLIEHDISSESMESLASFVRIHAKSDNKD